MIEPRSIYDAMKEHDKFITSSGDGTVEVYELRSDSKGIFTDELVLTGKKSLFDEIQAYHESTEIANIINRYANGETDVLYAVDGVYADVTKAPTSYADYFKKVREAEKIFNNLPEEIKDKFDNDPEKFFLEFGTDSFINKVSDENVVNETNKVKEEFDNAE